MTAWHRVKIAICQWQTDKQDWQRGPLLRYYSNYWLRSKKMLQLQPMSFGVGQTDPCCSCLPPEYIGKTSFVYFASNQVFFFRKSCVLSNLVLIRPPRAPSYKLIGGRMVESMFQDRSAFRKLWWWWWWWWWQIWPGKLKKIITNFPKFGHEKTPSGRICSNFNICGVL